MSEGTIERRIPWPRDRTWRPGEPITVTEEGGTTTYLLRGVMRDGNPTSAYATVRLEPMRTVAAEIEEPLSAAG
jgi:hypothetical protein